MKFIHRLGYYLGGFAIGLVILAFFLSGKRTTCAYGPNDRVLKDIRTKDRAFSETTLQGMKIHQIDTSDIAVILKHGKVIFNKSNTELDSCKTYFITGKVEDRNLELLIENCDSLATLRQLELVKLK